MHAFDRQTDGRMYGRTDGLIEFSSLDRVFIPRSAVKTNNLSINIITRLSHARRTLWYYFANDDDDDDDDNNNNNNNNNHDDVYGAVIMT